MKAVDYKGKHFILYDDDRVDGTWDFILPYIDTDWVIKNGLENHVAESIYYGIPSYVGKDKELLERIKKIEDDINRQESLSPPL